MAVTFQAVPPDQLGPLKLESFRCTPGPGDARIVEAAIRGLPSDPPDDALVIAAKDGSLTVGVAVAVPTPRVGWWSISVLAIRVPWQNRGHGRQLKDHCLHAIHDAGGLRVVSSVHPETAAMNRINQTIDGCEWGAEVSSVGVVYSIDLQLWAQAKAKDDAPRLFTPPPSAG